MNKNTRKIITAMLSAAMLTTSVTGLAANTVSFRDVSTTAWYYADIQTASELGIINGKGDNLFDPQGNLSVAEAIKLTACARAYYEGKSDELEQSKADGTHWVSKYISYAVENGIIDSVTDTKKLDTVITRDEMAKMFAKALPDTEYTAINNVSDMPDKNVPDYVKKLFKSGIMLGDSDGFRLGDTITRAETACIINRVLLRDKRQTAEKPLTAVVNSDKGKLHIGNTNDILAQIGGSSGNNNANDTSSSKREIPKDPVTGKYIATNDPSMSAYNRQPMIDYLYGEFQDKWYEGSEWRDRALNITGKVDMYNKFGGKYDLSSNYYFANGIPYGALLVPSDKLVPGDNRYIDSLEGIRSGDFVDVKNTHNQVALLVVERTIDGAVVIDPRSRPLKWKKFTLAELEKIASSVTYMEFNNLHE